ncbi:MAG TPA: hypothetical protein PKI59_05045, partial [Candidatus Cloacimonadota bacterium]|nr:hypothetical protein [Candidatus Cloacimonadota bacterium]
KAKFLEKAMRFFDITTTTVIVAIMTLSLTACHPRLEYIPPRALPMIQEVVSVTTESEPDSLSTPARDKLPPDPASK